MTRRRGAVQLLLVLGAAATLHAQQSTTDTVPRRGVRLCAGGDVALGTNLDTSWARKAADSLRQRYGLEPEPDSLLASLRPFIAGADIEGAIGEGHVPPKCRPRSTNCFAFRQPPVAADALARLVDTTTRLVGNVANNHSRDAGDAGRDSTIALLARAGIHVTGADTLATVVVTPRGDTVAVLGFYTDTSVTSALDLRAVRRHVARAVERYGVVVVTMHLGAEGPDAQRTRNKTEKFLGYDRGNPVAFANAALAGGATLVIGHGPHVLRAGEWRDERLVLYSLGNLLTYGPFRLREPTNRGAVACVTIDSARHVSGAELRATRQIFPGVLEADSTRRAYRLVDSLSALDFPRSGVRVDSLGKLDVRPRARAARRKP